MGLFQLLFGHSSAPPGDPETVARATSHEVSAVRLSDLGI